MTKSKADLILHPVRLKIIQELVGKTYTAQQLSELLPDVPKPTLYRHLNKLVQENILQIVQENQIRGTVEKVYALSNLSEYMTIQDLENMTREEHSQMFITFLANVMKDFENYLSGETVHLVQDGLTYRQAAMYLSDEEFVQFAMSLGEVFQKYLNNEATPERKRRSVTTIIIPEKNRK